MKHNNSSKLSHIHVDIDSRLNKTFQPKEIVKNENETIEEEEGATHGEETLKEPKKDFHILDLLLTQKQKKKERKVEEEQ